MGSKGFPDHGRHNGTAYQTVPMYDIGAYEQQGGVSTIILLL